MSGYKLREARGERTQKEVADALGISVSALSMYESGVRAPRDEVKVMIAHFYDRTVGELFFDEKVQQS